MGLFDKKSKFTIKKDYKLSEDSAIELVQKLFELYDFDIEGEEDEDVKKLKMTTAKNLVEYFRLGHLELKEDTSTIIQNLKYPVGDSPLIEYPEVRGKHKRAMDKYKQDELYGKAFSLLGSVSSLGIEAFDALKKYDSKVAESLGMLFLL